MRVDALKEGDAIVAASSSGTLTTDTVSLLSIAKPEARGAAFVVVSTSAGHNLTLTPAHHLPVGDTCCALLKKAADVAVGETVWVLPAARTGTFAATAVAATTVTAKRAVGASADVAGLHSPVLTHGAFPIVDGVVTSFDSHDKVGSLCPPADGRPPDDLLMTS